MWSSSESADAGMGLMDYLPNATIDNWLRDRVFYNQQPQVALFHKAFLQLKMAAVTVARWHKWLLLGVKVTLFTRLVQRCKNTLEPRMGGSLSP